MQRFLIIFLTFILGFLIILPFPKNTQGASCTNGPTRATDLIISPALSGFFSTSSGACVIDPQKAPFLPFKIPSYEDLKSIYYTQAKASASITKHASLAGDKTQDDIPMTTGTDHLYYMTGNLTITNNISGNQTGIVFVDGNLNIGSLPSNKLTYGNNNSGLVFTVKGDVNIDPSITQVDAIIISSGIIYTAGSSCLANAVTTTDSLTINGSLISLNGQKNIKFCRRILSGATAQAGEIINHQPKYLVILRNIFSDTLQRWSELDASVPIPSAAPTAASTIIIPPAPTGPTITISKSPVASGETVTVSWSNIPNATASDWFAIHKPGTAAGSDTVFNWSFTNCTKTPGTPGGGSMLSSGSCNLKIAAQNGQDALPDGTYDLLYLYNNTYNTVLATSSTFTVTPAPIALWHMDETSGSTVADSSGNSNNGTATGASITTGISNNARLFNGSTNFVKINSSSNWAFSGDFTVETWIYPTVSGSIIGDYYIGGTSTSPDWQLLYNSTYKSVNFWRGNNIATTANNSIPTNTWSHIALVRSGTAVTLYVNGQASATGTLSGTIGRGLNLWIGIDGNELSEPYTGKIDEVKIYNTVRSAADILADYLAYNLKAGLVSYWKMDEPSGSTVADSTGSNNGNATGTSIVAGKFGNGRSFNGSSDNIDFGTGPRIRQTSTVGWWAKVNSGGGGYFFQSEVWNDGGNFFSLLPAIRLDNGLPQAWGYSNLNYTRSDFFVNGSGDLRDGQWHYYTLVFNNNIGTFYVDGISQGQNGYNFTSWDSAINYSGLKAGKDCRYYFNSCAGGTAYDYFNGVIDEVGVWNRSLSATEVSQLYAGQQLAYAGSGNPQVAGTSTASPENIPTGLLGQLLDMLRGVVKKL